MDTNLSIDTVTCFLVACLGCGCGDMGSLGGGLLEKLLLLMVDWVLLVGDELVMVLRLVRLHVIGLYY